MKSSLPSLDVQRQIKPQTFIVQNIRELSLSHYSGFCLVKHSVKKLYATNLTFTRLVNINESSISKVTLRTAAELALEGWTSLQVPFPKQNSHLGITVCNLNWTVQELQHPDPLSMLV